MRPKLAAITVTGCHLIPVIWGPRWAGAPRAGSGPWRLSRSGESHDSGDDQSQAWRQAWIRLIAHLRDALTS